MVWQQWTPYWTICLTGTSKRWQPNFLRNKQPALPEDIPFQTWLQMYFQHNTVPLQYSTYDTVPDWAVCWLMDWVWLSAELATLVTGLHFTRFAWKIWHMNAKQREERTTSSNFQCCKIHDDPDVLYKVTYSIVKRGRMCNPTDYGHFKHLLNQTVHYIL
jgi:hypothetical protein